MVYSKSIKRLQNALAYRSLVVIRWMIGSIPYFILIRFMNTMLSIVYVFMLKVRRDVRYNLQAAFGDEKNEAALEAMTKGCLKNAGQSMIDMLYYSNRPDKVEDNVAIEGRSYLENSLSLGRGVVAVTAHLGNFPIMFMKLMQEGFKVNVIIRPMRDKSFERFMFAQTDRWGINMIRTRPRKEFLKKTIKALKHNELLFILLDEDAKEKNSVSVNFLNRKLPVVTGPMLFHERMGSPIHTILTITEPNGNLKVTISPALKVVTHHDSETNMASNIAHLVKSIEDAVLAYPLQWGGWMNKVWRQEKAPA